MTNEELKKKICDIIAPYVSAYGDDERIADALIAAGMVDKSDYASMKETAVRYKAEVSKAEARVKEAELRAEEAESELERYTGLIKPLEDENARLEHRAARAERALYKASKDIKDICEYIVKIGGTGVITIKNYAPERAEPSAYIDRAEKELAEERKDD